MIINSSLTSTLLQCNDKDDDTDASSICYNIQIMTKVYILSCFMPFLAYSDKKRANGPISLSLYSRNGIKQDRIYTEVIICFISQSGHLKQLIIR